MTTTIANGSTHGALRAGKQPRYQVEECRTDGQRTTAVVSAEEIAWLVTHLRAVVAASPTAWAGKGMTLLQLTALHIISAQAPVALTDLAQVLGTGPPATSAMVDRLIRTGLVARTSDLQDRRRIQLTITDQAKTMIGEIDLSTARRLQAALNHMSPPARRHLIDVLRDTVRRSAGQPTKHRPSRRAAAPRTDRVHSPAAPPAMSQSVRRGQRWGDRRYVALRGGDGRGCPNQLPGAGAHPGSCHADELRTHHQGNIGIDRHPWGQADAPTSFPTPQAPY